MTRETKIGLLVGLAFIIVTGILLTDPLLNKPDPAPAPLDKAAGTIMAGLRTPGGNPMPANPPSGPSVVSPALPVPVTHEMTPRPTPPVVQQIDIGPGTGGDGGAATISIGPGTTGIDPRTPAGASETPRSEVATILPVAPERDTAAPIEQTATTVTPPLTGPEHRDLVAIGRAMGEDIVPVGGGAARSQSVTPRSGTGTEYRAVAGDNLHRLAGKLPGGNTKANRDAILKANPSLQANPDKIIVGQAYVLPSVAAVTPAPAPALRPVAPPAPAAPAPAAPSAPRPVASGTESWYTVKKGENLTRIAREQLGDTALVPVIKELNKESLKGSDMVREGQKIRLPARSIATTS